MPDRDVRAAALAAAREVLARVEVSSRPVVVHADKPGVRVVVRVVAVGRTECERDVLLVLGEAGRERYTTMRVLAELERRDLGPYGEITVKRTLARLVKDGVIEKSTVAPRGYALPRPAA